MQPPGPSVQTAVGPVLILRQTSGPFLSLQWLRTPHNDLESLALNLVDSGICLLPLRRSGGPRRGMALDFGS